MNLYILGEESPSHEILTLLSWYFKEFINVKPSDVFFKPLNINNNLFFEVVGSGISQYDKIYYAMVSSTGNSFADYMIFEGDNPPEEDSKPLAAIEATKNLGKESGNMSDQRAPKMIALIEKHGNELRCGYLVNNHNTIDETIDSFSHAHDCAFATMNAIGVEVVVAQYGSSKYEEYQVPFKYDCIENVIAEENKKRKGSGTPSRVFRKGDNEFKIQVNLYKSKGTHDPGEGYLASRAYVIRKLQPNAVITIINHGRNEDYFNRKNNKLINLLKFVGVNVDMEDSTINIERNEGVYNKGYWEYTKTGEKNASIVLEQLLIQKGFEINFTNHAGCGKSYIKINGQFFQSKKTKGIPDIVAFDRDNNTLLVIEGETSKNYRKGIKQVLDPAFDTFIKNEFVSHIGEDVKVKKYLCTFGKYNNEPEVLFNLTENYKMNYNENAEVVK